MRRAIADATQLHASAPRSRRARSASRTTPRAARRRNAGLPVVAVQHHLAHVAACMAEHGIAAAGARRRLGRHRLWRRTARSGAASSCWSTRTSWRRVAHLRPFRLPGGEAAIREPRRAALGLLYEAFGDEALAMTDLAPVAAFSPPSARSCSSMLARGVNAPCTSSAGRLFDAFAALCGLRQQRELRGPGGRPSWNGRPRAARAGRSLPSFAVRETERRARLDRRLAAGARGGARRSARGQQPPARSPTRCTTGLPRRSSTVARRSRTASAWSSTGGCFQNARLTEATVAALARRAGFEPDLAPARAAQRRRNRPRPGRLGGLAAERGEVLHVPSRSRKDSEHLRRRSAHAASGGSISAASSRRSTSPIVPEARIGDYVLVHVGFAITVIDEAEAARVFELSARDRRAHGGAWSTHEISRRVPRRRRRAAALPPRSPASVTRPWTLMEVCGGQTHAIVRFGIDELLPEGRDAGPRPRLPGLRDAGRL